MDALYKFKLNKEVTRMKVRLDLFSASEETTYSAQQAFIHILDKHCLHVVVFGA